MVLPEASTCFGSSKCWLRICTPELRAGSTLNSSSNVKSPYSFLVHRNELGVLGTDDPTMVSPSIRYLALPPRCTKLSRFLPLNNGTQPFSAAFVCWLETTTMSVAARKPKASGTRTIGPAIPFMLQLPIDGLCCQRSLCSLMDSWCPQAWSDCLMMNINLAAT